MHKLTTLAIALLVGAALAGCAFSPDAVRSSEPSAVVAMKKSPHDAAYCIADLADQRMRHRLGSVNNNHVRLRSRSASVISVALSEHVAWLIDIEATDNGSIARLYIGDRSFLYADQIERDGRAIIKECA